MPIMFIYGKKEWLCNSEVGRSWNSKSDTEEWRSLLEHLDKDYEVSVVWAVWCPLKKIKKTALSLAVQEVIKIFQCNTSF